MARLIVNCKAYQQGKKILLYNRVYKHKIWKDHKYICIPSQQEEAALLAPLLNYLNLTAYPATVNRDASARI